MYAGEHLVYHILHVAYVLYISNLLFERLPTFVVVVARWTRVLRISTKHRKQWGRHLKR